MGDPVRLLAVWERTTPVPEYEVETIRRTLLQYPECSLRCGRCVWCVTALAPSWTIRVRAAMIRFYVSLANDYKENESE